MSPRTIAALVAVVEAIVDERVDARLAQLGVVPSEYSSTNPPPAKTSRTFNRWCRSGKVAGATKDGATWRCTVEAWRKARAGAPAPVLRVVPDLEDVGTMLEGAGLRRTRGQR